MDAALPPLYAAWLAELYGGAIPAETEATCDDCAMCARPGETIAGEVFNRDTKCCTYQPELHNFLVGRILADRDPAAAAGRATVLARLRAGAAVTPLGLGRSRPYGMLYKASVDSFGHSRSMRCPHYLDEQGGRCGVWRHRMSMCATWFCKHVRGAVGQHFWKATHRLLASCERSLSAWCVLALDPGRDALERLFRVHNGTAGEEPLQAAELDGVGDPALQRILWGSWAGREEEFFLACSERVARLSFAEVLAIGGPEVQIAAHLARLAYAELHDASVPAVLRLGPFEVVSGDAESARVSTYNAYDPLAVPRALFDVLHRFDGRPVADVIETLAAGDGVEVDLALVRRLADFRVLVP